MGIAMNRASLFLRNFAGMIKIDRRYMDGLPVSAVADRLNKALESRHAAVVTAPPGSGKSTLLPLTILQGQPEGKIVMLEPRRAAARQIALRMASMLGEKPGETVGYRMRFESKVSPRTRIEVVTEGVMERMLIDDPTLDGVTTVIFDEFHERSLTADLSLALTLEARNVLRPDLRIVLMSATIDVELLCRALGAELIEASGTLHNVEIVYGEDVGQDRCVPAVVSTVRKAWRCNEGNILVFLPGQAEISACCSALSEFLEDAAVFPLHGLLPPEEQYRAIEYNPAGRRKIVVASPIAETSLTIEGIKAVVDSGLYRRVEFTPSNGLSRLVTARISCDMADQRAGRAGRLSDGVCYRLWSKATESRMAACRTPEISEADLSRTVLDIAAWGGCRPENLPWLTPPPPGHLADARRLLTMLGALDEDGAITGHGRRMAALPCHPRIAGMLATAADDRLRALAADIAAILEEKDPVDDETDADIGTRIDLLRHQRVRGVSGRWRRIAVVAAQYRRLVRCAEDNSAVNADETGRLLANAYPERIAQRFGDGIYRLPGGENVRLNDGDALAVSEFLAVASVGKRIFLASPISREAVLERAKLHRNLSWNSREGRLTARDERRIGVLVVSSCHADDVSREEIVQTIANAAAKDGRSMFTFDENLARLQRRLEMVGEWHPEMEIPDVSDETLLATAPSWLPLYAGDATTAQELRKIDLCEVVKGLVGYQIMAGVDRLAPTHFKLPRGRVVRIDYRAGSPDPVLSARLADCLGLADTPCVDGGRRPVLVELLSPGFRPVQLTRDLRGFWTTTYYDVRKQLRGRYPKHPWPDNPLDYNEK